MSRELAPITNQNTFGVWKTRTNDIIDVLDVAVTIGDSETNTGNVVIGGDISASGTLYIDTIQETSGSGSNLITVNADLGVEGDIIMDKSSGAATLTYSLANTPTWTIATSTDHSQLDIKKGTKYLRIDTGTAAEITGSGLTLDLDLFPTSGTIALNTTGSAGSADAWSSARTVSFATGDVTGSFSISGSADVADVELVVADNSHSHTIANVTNLDTSLAAKAALAGAVFTGDVTAQSNLFLGKTAVGADADGYASINYSNSDELYIKLWDGTTTNTAGMRIDLDGKSLYINNGSDAKISFSSSSGDIVTAGDITAFGSPSDRNLKENIVKIDNALEKVSQISGYTFNYIGNNTPMTGVIAQEIEEVLPEVVYETEMPDGTQSKAVRYGNIVGLLIESIKELKAEIEELKKDK